ncbi:MAG: PatB family C-S lyase [Desulfobulbus sp.]|nr:PatB family C-S lyase [Desulfobulbus sp.]
MKTAPFDFDTVIDRCRSSSLKWGHYQGRDILPLWVADMDFPSPPAVMAALHQRIDHGIFGYTLASESLVEAVMAHLDQHYGWQIQPQWLVWLPGLVTGLNAVCRAVGQAGDEVITFTPIYPPFVSAPELMGQKTVCVPLREVRGRWSMDLEALARAITPKTRLLLLCNPHNPVGRVWSRGELLAVAQLAEEHDLILCSDEIHADLILDADKHHLPLAMLDPAISHRTITLQAPSKTYNIPGLGCSYAVVADPSLRRRLHRAMEGIVPHVNLLGYAAAEAAYRHGEPWRLALMQYLRDNRDLLTRKIDEMPGLALSPVEATYLAWIDVRERDLEDPQGFFEAAGVGLSDGRSFGLPGFVRLNFGCPRSLLIEALERMQRSLA